MLRTHKADRVDLKRLEHRLSSQINETAISAGAGASQRPVLTNKGRKKTTQRVFCGQTGKRPSTGAVFPSMLAMR